jgi:hypothetical protein
MRKIEKPARFVSASTTYEFDLNDPDCMKQIEEMFRVERIVEDSDYLHDVGMDEDRP